MTTGTLRKKGPPPLVKKTRAGKKIDKRNAFKDDQEQSRKLLVAAQVRLKAKRKFNHTEIIGLLRRENIWSVDTRNGTITLSKAFGKKNPQTISLSLKSTGTPTSPQYYLEPLVYTFKSAISHYNYCRPESRWTRNKTYIKASIKFLQETDVWPYIENRRSYIMTNDNNSRLEDGDLIGIVQEELQGILE